MRRWSSRHNTRVSYGTAAAPRRRLRAPAPLLLAAALCYGATGCSQSSNNMSPDMGSNPFGGVAGCKGTQISTDGTLDVDVKTLHVTGKVTLNGADMADSTLDRGTIVFREKHTSTTTQLRLGMQGAAHYQAVLAPAEYDVSYLPNNAACKMADNKLPCNSGPLKSGLKLTASGALDLDIPAVTVTGKFTVNGAAVPADGQDQASVSFTRSDVTSGGSVSTGALGTFLHNYSVVLLKGSYDIAYQSPSLGCANTSSVPCISGPLKKAVTLSDSGVLDVDIPTVKLTGKVTVNGQAPGGTDIQLGVLSFQLQNGGTLTTAGVQPSTYLEPYQITLLGGTYDIHFAPRNATCQGTVPCIDARIKKGVALSQSGVLDVDVPSIQLDGKVTINGQPVDAPSETASLLFINTDKGQVATAAYGAHKLSQYHLSLVPGVYQVQFAPGDGSNCSRSAALAPCIGGVLKKEVAIQQTGNLDVDVPVVNINGRITVNGMDVAGTARTQGQLVFSFADATGGSLSTPDLGPYSVRLLPGTFQVKFQSGLSAHGCDMTAQVPCNSGLVKDNVTISQSGSLDIDVGMVHVTGRVTLDGMPMPTTTENRGQLLFILGTSAAYSPSFGNSGAVTYDVELLKGAYEIAHYPQNTDCAMDRQIPCVGQVMLGCD